MKNRFSPLIAALAALSVAAASSAHAQLVPVANNTGLASPTSTVTFSELTFPRGTAITTQFSPYGLSFSPALYYNTQGPASFPGITGDYLGNFSPITNPFSIFFASPLGAAAFGFATNPAISTFTAFLAGIPVASFASPTSFNGSTPYYFGFQSLGSETFDQIQVSISSDLGLIDNVQTAGSVVPEPASMVLLGTGLIGVFGVARRRWSGTSA